MPEKARGIPIVGRVGLLFIVGAVVGAVFRVWMGKLRSTQGWLSQSLFDGFIVADLLCYVVPVALLIFLKRFKAFFVGWIAGVLACEIAEQLESRWV